ncbi:MULTISPECIES: hypothetical protein [Acinetobacter]|uniref:hypothetical protein n=1 Tax=Acinetobacter TaxID=469 RepID=UPI001F4F3263|nr:hypothetical protein [Acinetobacter guerrae]
MSKKIKVLDIYLDTDNPRHDPINDQPEIIAHLLKEEKVKNLAKDIAENGISPIELLAVVKGKGNKYIVVEGNRRVCALILLNDPERAPNQNLKDYFKKLKARSALIPDSVNCEVFDRREKADLWIERRHEGEQSGVGARQWNAVQKTRHNARLQRSDDNTLAQAIIDYAINNSLVKNNETGRILTTASRYLGNPFFRKTLGITSSRSDLNVQIATPIFEFEKVITKFCLDLIESADPNSSEMTVSSRSSSADVEQYARQLIHDGYAPITHIEAYLLKDANSREQGLVEIVTDTSDMGDVGNFDVDKDGTPDMEDAGNSDGEGDGTSDMEDTENSDADETDTSNISDEERADEEVGPISTSGQPGTTQDPNKRKYLVTSKLIACISDNTLRRVYGELRKIEIDQSPLAVMLVARAFLEVIYIKYFEDILKNKYDKNKIKMHVVLQKVCDALSSKKNELNHSQVSALAVLKKLPSDQNKIFAAGNLGLYAHAVEYPSNKTQIIIEWDNILAIVQYMLVELYNANE